MSKKGKRSFFSRLFRCLKRKEEKDENKESKKVKIHTGTIRVQRMYKMTGTIDETSDAGFLETKTFPPNVEPAHIGTSLSMTVNLGNYQSVKVGVFVQVPCLVEEMDNAYKKVHDVASEKLSDEIEEIKSWKEKLKEVPHDE